MLPDAVRLLVEAGRQAPSADNSQPWRMVWDGRRLSLAYREPAHGSLFQQHDIATRLAMGAATENIMQLSEPLGLSRETAASATETLDASYLSVSVPPETRVASELRHHPVFGRHTNRFAFRADRLPDVICDEIERASERSARVKVLVEDREREEAAALVRVASEVRFRMRRVHEWFMSTLRFTPDDVNRGDGLDVRTLHLPPGGPMLLRAVRDWRRMELLNRIGAYRAFARIEAHPLRSAPAIVAIQAKRDLDGALAGGQLMERVWSMLNSRGVAVHPYYVVPDILDRIERHEDLPARFGPEIAGFPDNVRGFFGVAPGNALYMLLRIGYPTRSPVRARRRPVEDVCPNG